MRIFLGLAALSAARAERLAAMIRPLVANAAADAAARKVLRDGVMMFSWVSKLSV
jgi:hypothetical protein